MRERCRACGAPLPENTLLSFENMPKSAQHFPTAQTVGEDSGVTIALKECPYCALVQAMGHPVSYYRDVIRAVGVSQEMRQFRLGQFRQWVRECHLEGKRVLEVGSGRGEYLAMMEETGTLAWGLEHDPSAVSAAVQAGHRMVEGFVEDAETALPGAPYDAFFCLNFLEHIPAPAEFLRGIFNNLTGDAWGLVEVPSFRSMLEKSLYSEFIQDHLSYFTEESFRNLLSNSGFEVLSMEEIWYGYILSARVRKRRPTSLTGMLDKRAALREKVQRYLAGCRTRGLTVAAWGAGHQALANLSLLGMADYLDCVIDSAPFKQNKLTPATHLPIVGPERLAEGNIGAVIIMAAGYSEEIRRILEREYPNLEKSVLSDDFLVL